MPDSYDISKVACPSSPPGISRVFYQKHDEIFDVSSIKLLSIHFFNRYRIDIGYPIYPTLIMLVLPGINSIICVSSVCHLTVCSAYGNDTIQHKRSVAASHTSTPSITCGILAKGALAHKINRQINRKNGNEA